MADPRVELHVEVVDGITPAIEQLQQVLPAGEALDADRRGEPRCASRIGASLGTGVTTR